MHSMRSMCNARSAARDTSGICDMLYVVGISDVLCTILYVSVMQPIKNASQAHKHGYTARTHTKTNTHRCAPTFRGAPSIAVGDTFEKSMIWQCRSEPWYEHASRHIQTRTAMPHTMRGSSLPSRWEANQQSTKAIAQTSTMLVYACHVGTMTSLYTGL